MAPQTTTPITSLAPTTQPSLPTAMAGKAPMPGPSSSSTSSTPAHDLQCLNIRELEIISRECMDKQTRDYYNEGADDNSTLYENQHAYQKYRIRPRVLRNISAIDTTTTVFGQKNSVPFGVAPTAMQCLAHSDGELGTARACRSQGIVMGLSSFATSTLEDVAEASGDNANVLQLYLFEEKSHSAKLINRAKAAGYKAVLLTVDTPMLGRRNAEIRNQFSLPPHLEIANFVGPDDKDRPKTDEQVEADADNTRLPNQGRKVFRPRVQKRKKSAAGYYDAEKGERVQPTGPITFHTHAANPTLSWEDSIPWLKQVCGKEMEVWVKGVATSEDALLAVEHGCDGIVVSNHGGRQLNGALATIDALPEVVEAVKGRIPIHIDGGIRHGSDIFKALALGADFAWVGRPVLWGLAYKGEEGVRLCLRLLMDEFRLCMGLAGCCKVSEIDKSFLVKMDRSGFPSKL